MKKGKIVLVFSFIIGACNVVSSATYTWSPTLGNSANTILNWFPQIGVPGPADDVVFNTNVSNCTWNIGAVNSISVMTGYTGIISMGSTNVTLNGNLVINGGSFVSTSGNLRFAGTGAQSFILAGGTFNANSGNVVLDVAAGTTFNFSGAIVMSTLTIGGGATNNSREINFGSNLSVNVLVMAVQTKIHAYQGTVHIKNILDIGNNASAASYSVSPSNNTATFIFDGSSALIYGVSNAIRAPLPNFVINTAGTFALLNQINIVGNWTGTRGTHIIGTSSQNFIGVNSVISGTAVAFDNLAVASGASAQMPANVEVKIGGNLTITGALTFQTTSSLGFNAPGGTNQTISGAGFTLAGVKAYDGASSRNVTFNTAVSILDSLKIGNQVTLASGGNITLKSSSALTSRLAQMGTSASITGNVIVETMIPGGNTGWALMGARGVNGQTVANWDTYYSSVGANGIPMTCVGCYYSPAAITSWFESIQGWNETNAFGYDTNIVVGTSINPGKGYWVYVGDGMTTTNDLKLVNTGLLNTGAVSLSVTAGGAQSGFNLIANPYPSPISWDAVIANTGNTTTVNNAIYAFNANTGAYTQYVGGLASPGAPNGISNIVAAGQGFYVQAISSGNLVFNEANKSTANTSSNPLIRPTGPSDIGQYFRLRLDGANDNDVCTFRIHDNASNSFDQKYDALKMFQSPGYVGYPGFYDKYTTISSKDTSGVDYAIQSLPPLVEDVRIPILARVSSSGTYTFSTIDFNGNFSCVELFDKINNVYHDLKGSPYMVTISDTMSKSCFDLLLCKSDFSNALGISKIEDSKTIFISRDAHTVKVKTTFEKYARGTISVYDIVGQKLVEDIHIEGKETNTNIPVDDGNQLLIIKVSTDQGSSSKKVVVY